MYIDEMLQPFHLRLGIELPWREVAFKMSIWFILALKR